VGEVLGWFEKSGLRFVRAIPSPALEPEDLAEVDLFSPGPRGGAAERRLTELRQIVTGSREGGFFLMIGHKPELHGAVG
jgi:hypothetical protein